MPLITFLSDFGLEDAYVGVVKGVILGLAPEARIVDLTHLVPPQDIAAGAFLLETAVAQFPPDTVHLAVVDPGVGTARLGLALTLGGHSFVGPDNGLFSLALRRLARQRGLALKPTRGRLRLPAEAQAVWLTQDTYWRHPVSPTFHARDVFGPVAAHLARGVSLTDLGRPVSSVATLPALEPVRTGGALHGQVQYVDRFGNLITNVPGDLVRTDAVIELAGVVIRGLSPTYGLGQALAALVGSSGYLEVALPGGRAASTLKLERGASVRVTQSLTAPVVTHSKVLPGEGG